MADVIPLAEHAAIVADARRAVADATTPALRRFKAFIAGTFRPKAPDVAGLAGIGRRALLRFPRSLARRSRTSPSSRSTRWDFPKSSACARK